jgi:predicted permease
MVPIRRLILPCGLLLMGASLVRQFSGHHDPRLSVWGLVALAGIVVTLLAVLIPNRPSA